MRVAAAAALLALIAAAPVVLAASSYSFQATIGEQSTVTGEFTVSLDTPSNTTGTISIYFNNATGDFYLNLALNSYLGLEGFDAHITGSGSYQVDNGNYTSSYSFQGTITVYNITLGGGAGFGPSQFPPIGGGEGGVSSPLNATLSFTGSGSEEGYTQAGRSWGSGSAQLDVYFENGATLLLGMPGDIVANVTSSYQYEATPEYTEVYATITVNFDSGNETIDSFLAGALNTFIQGSAMGGGTSGELTVTSTLVNATAVEITISGRITGQAMSPGMGPGAPIEVNATIVPAAANVTATASYQFTLTAGDGWVNVTAQAGGNAQIGDLLRELPAAPSYIDVEIQIDNTTVTGTIEASSVGDPEASFAAVKALLVAVAENLEPGDAFSAALTAEGGYEFVLLREGRVELGSQVTLTQENATLIKHIYLEPPGVDVESKAEGVFLVKSEAGGKAKVEIGVQLLAEAKKIEVESKAVVIETGRIVVGEEKEIVVNATDAKAVVKLYAGTEINGSLEVEALNETEAQAEAGAHGYTAAGDGVRVDGVANGTVEIAVSGDVQAAQEGRLAILEISADGTVKLITDVSVEGDMIVFVTSSFSTFVPVYTEETGGEATTTTTQEETTTTTTTTGTIAEKTTTTTTTTTTGEETATSETTTTTTTEAPGETTTQKGTATGTAGEQGGGGIGATTAAAVLMVIIIVAAAFLLVRK